MQKTFSPLSWMGKNFVIKRIKKCRRRKMNEKVEENFLMWLSRVKFFKSRPVLRKFPSPVKRAFLWQYENYASSFEFLGISLSFLFNIRFFFFLFCWWKNLVPSLFGWKMWFSSCFHVYACVGGCKTVGAI